MKHEETAHHPETSSDIPTKCVQQTRTITVNASITYIDFEGRSDGESLQKILAQLRPRRVVFVRGSAKDTEIMAQQAQAAGARVFIPGRGETLDATTETHIYQVHSLYSTLFLNKLKLISANFLHSVFSLTIHSNFILYVLLLLNNPRNLSTNVERSHKIIDFFHRFFFPFVLINDFLYSPFPTVVNRLFCFCIFPKVRLTDALVSGLNFSKGRGDSEVAWIDALMTARDHICRDAVSDTELEESNSSDKILTLEPLPLNEVNFHFIPIRMEENFISRVCKKSKNKRADYCQNTCPRFSCF